jgi:hypothetical protein
MPIAVPTSLTDLQVHYNLSSIDRSQPLLRNLSQYYAIVNRSIFVGSLVYTRIRE